MGSPAASSDGRVAVLDTARALGVVAMVAGHVLDAVLLPAARATPLVSQYWKARGFTAPLFLAVAGWTLTVATRRKRAEGLSVALERLPRVLLLLAMGYALRWPGWGTELLRSGDPVVNAHFLSFDVLHTISLSILASALVLGLGWTVREKALAFVLLVLLSVALGMSHPTPLQPDPSLLPAHPVALAIVQAAGGTSQFPLFPWAGYFFAGSLLGLLAGNGSGMRALWIAAAGGAMVIATKWTGVGQMPPGHPVLFVFRTGAVLLILAALCAAPARLGALLAPLGRASLGVYVFHVSLVYGWYKYEGLWTRVGPTQPLPVALLAAALVLAASLAATMLLKGGLAAARTLAPAARGFAAALFGRARGEEGGED